MKGSVSGKARMMKLKRIQRVGGRTHLALLHLALPSYIQVSNYRTLLILLITYTLPIRIEIFVYI